MRLFFLTFFVFVSAHSPAQSVSIFVSDRSGNPVPGATVCLMPSADTAKKVYVATDSNGSAVFTGIQDGVYIIRITNIGFLKLEKNILVNSENRRFAFTLSDNEVQLNAVTITAERPFIHQEEDKMIVDPSPMVGISSNTLEVLESTPGIYVDYESGIYLSSTTPAVVYINGREQKLSNQDIMNMLRNLPPGSIERIEILRTPSSKYDAESTGGIVNVVLKKGVKLGRFGNLAIGMNQGKYGNRYVGFNFNNSGDKTTFYLNMNYNRNDMQEETGIDRGIGTDAFLNQTNSARKTNDQTYLGFGITYDLNEKASVSYDGRLSYSDRLTNTASLSQTSNSSELLLAESNDLLKNSYWQWNFINDFGLNVKTDTLGSEWDTKFSFSSTPVRGNQQYSSAYTIPFDTILKGEGYTKTPRKFLMFQSDLTQQLPHKIKLETGIKGSWQDFSSQSVFHNTHDGSYDIDSGKSNTYSYREGIGAAYLQASKSLWANIILKTGCRFEYTYMDGQQTFPSDTGFRVNQAGLFPYVYLSRKLPTILGISLNTYMIYRRTLSRPGYDELNPALNYISPFLYQSGNPELKPQYTDNVEFNISYEDVPVFAIGVNKTRDIFADVLYEDPREPGSLIMTTDNLGSSSETYLRGLVGIPPGGRYFFALGGQYNLTEYNGYYNGEPLSWEHGSWRFFTFHSLKISKNTKFNMGGFYLLKGQQGFYELGNFGSLNMNITQMLFRQKLMVSIYARDIFTTMKMSFTLNQGDISAAGDRYSDTHRFGINIRYNFGIGKKEHSNGFNIPDDAM